MKANTTVKLIAPMVAHVQQQKGMVLIIALLIMVSMTILGVSTMSSTSLEEKMTFNFRDRQLAFQAAEAALREGERFVASNNMDPAKFYADCETGSPGWCECSAGCSVEYWSDAVLDVWNDPNKHREYTIAYSEVSAAPRYIIERMGNTCSAQSLINSGGSTCQATDPVMFRITALGYGASASTRVMLQSTYRKD